jgi:ParB/RepB/Spo0J family partition protein
MSETTLITLNMIEHNRYQARKEYTDIDALGRSIAMNGLDQPPKARELADGAHELKFGHRRFEAFKWLNENWQTENLPDRYEGYTVMPLVVEEMTDVQMYEGMVIENEQRQDLNDIEKALVIREYRTTFGKNSAEAGALLGMNEATVRGIERFLELPAAAQKALAEKKITQGTARLLLSAQKLGGEKVVKEALKELLSSDSSNTPEEIIEHEVDRLENVFEMWGGGWKNEKPRAGRDLWLLDMKNFPNKMLPYLTGHIAVQTLDCFNDKPAQKLVLEWAEYLGADDAPDSGDEEIDADYHAANKNQMQIRMDALEKINPDYTAALQHLLNPPACNACPFYTVINKAHYCGMKACYERKAIAFRAQKMADMSRTLKIPIYAEADGSYLVLDSGVASHTTAFKNCHADLRLLPAKQFKGYAWQSFKGLDSGTVKLVAVGSSLDKLAVGSSKGKTVGKKSEKEKAEARAMRLYRQVRRELMWGYVVEAEGIFAGVPVEALKKLNEWNSIMIDDRIPEEYERNPGGDTNQYQRRSLVWRLIMRRSSHFSRTDLVKQLQAFEKQTTVKPSKVLLKRAQDWDTQIHALASVAVETGKGKKK